MSSDSPPTSAAPHPGDEIRALLAEHAPHLLDTWDISLRLHRSPDYLRALADTNESAKPVDDPVSIQDLFLPHPNPTKADRLAAAERLRKQAARLVTRADEIEQEVAADV